MKSSQYWDKAIEIPLSQGMNALIDADDFDKVNKYNWCLDKRKDGRMYAVNKIKGKPKVYMHRLILSPSDSQQVDHREGAGLDNRKANLRICTNAQNSRNNNGQPTRRKSPYKGVFKCSQTKKWRVRILVDGINIHVGYFDKPEDAARAYDRAAIEHHKSFAKTNFPRSDYEG